MSRLTFLGWLKMELARMSGHKTVSIHKLAHQVQYDNSRLAEPLLLYAMETGTVSRLLHFIEDEKLKKEYLDIIEMCGGLSIVDLSEDKKKELPWGYKKLLENWWAAEKKQQHVENSKRLRLERSLQLMDEKKITNAQVYQALSLNPGNTNAFFKNRDTTKLSLENTTRIMKYLYSL